MFDMLETIEKPYLLPLNYINCTLDVVDPSLYVQQKQCSVMPPKTNAERSRTKREKIKNDNVNYEAAKKTDRERKQQARRLKKASAAASEKKEKQRKERDAKRRQRQKKKDARARAQTTVNDENNGPYKTKNTLGKAVSKVKRALPATPNRESCSRRTIVFIA